MNIETRLKSAIVEKLGTISTQDRRAAALELSNLYRSHQPSKISDSSQAVFLAYIATRMPATFSVVQTVLEEFLELTNESPKSMLDIGAGPATASFAALELFDDLNEVSLFEKQKRFQDLAIELARLSAVEKIVNATWQIGSIEENVTFPISDLAIASYSLSEMPISLAKTVAQKAFDCAVLGLVIIEPGTPQGFERILALRTHLLAHGAYIAAPCAHQLNCPMVTPDFCHFSKRLVREAFHREAKNASLPFEDEKFSYLIATKSPKTTYFGRLIKRPIKSAGHVTLDICHEGKIERQVVGRSNKARYKTARKSSWGDRVT